MRLTTRAQAHPCPRCHAATIAGLTQAPAAWTAITDPIPLSPPAEIRALINGRMTYDLMTIGKHHELIARDSIRMKHHDWPVLAAHKCPGPVPWIPPLVKQFPPEKSSNDICPF